MISGLSDFVLGARENGSKWVDILAPLIVMIAWVVIGTMKWRRSRADNSDERVSSRPAPRQREPQEPQTMRQEGRFEFTEDARERISRQQRGLGREEKTVAPKKAQPVVRTVEPVAAEIMADARGLGLEEEVLEAVSEEYRPAKKKPLVRAKFGPSLEKPLKVRAKKAVKAKAEHHKVIYDISGPDELRRAIVHYEILGLPLGLRDV